MYVVYVHTYVTRYILLYNVHLVDQPTKKYYVLRTRTSRHRKLLRSRRRNPVQLLVRWYDDTHHPKDYILKAGRWVAMSGRVDQRQPDALYAGLGLR